MTIYMEWLDCPTTYLYLPFRMGSNKKILQNGMYNLSALCHKAELNSKPLLTFTTPVMATEKKAYVS